MSKHTKGPWKAGRPDMGTYVGGVLSKWIYSADDQYVAVASGKIKGSWDEVMANAHLIAAAPEMLEALEEIISIIKIIDLQESLGIAKKAWAELQSCEAAIKKAKGDEKWE